MNKETRKLLDKHFETAFDTPDGIKKLRELILTLAMRGRLVPQDQNDQPASELLKEIAAEKDRLIKEGKLKPQKPLPPIDPKEIPYQLPKGWEWVRLQNAFDVRDGTHDTPKYTVSGFPLITSKNLYTGRLSFEDVKFISEHDHNRIKERSRVDLGDILFAMIGSIGNPVIVECEHEFSIKNVALFKFYKANTPERLFLHNFLLSSQTAMKAISSGAVQSFVSLNFIRNYLFPLPPLAEQKRIVARVEQLIARCDELEKLRAARDEKRLETHAAALNALFAAADSGDFSTAWKFISRNFDELYTVKENVAELRKAILQLAVMGRLVPQDPNDQPASELLKEIAAEKARLIKEGKLKPQKPLPPIDPKEIPYKLAKGWEWVRFDQLIDQRFPISYGVLVPGPDTEDGVPFVRIEDLTIKNPKEKPGKRIGQDIASNYERTKLEGGEILMGVVGSIGKLGIAPESWKGAYIARAVCRIFPSSQVDKKYILWILQSNFMQTCFASETRTLAQPTLNIGLIRAALTPLPPLEEQKRIVARVEQLMALCDGLEQSIAAADGSRAALLDSLMANV